MHKLVAIAIIPILAAHNKGLGLQGLKAEILPSGSGNFVVGLAGMSGVGVLIICLEFSV